MPGDNASTPDCRYLYYLRSGRSLSALIIADLNKSLIGLQENKTYVFV